MDSTHEWTKPELIVLGRGAPEENVLCGCKSRPCVGHNGCATKRHNILCQNPHYTKS
jgi:hypothetical protein